MPKKENSVFVLTANVRDAFAGIPYLVEDSLPPMVISGPDNHKPYGHSLIDAIVQSMDNKTVWAKFESVDFETHLRKTLNNIVSSPRKLVKMAKALLDTEEFLERLAHVVKTENNK